MRHSRARAGGLHTADPELRVGISLLSSLAIPLHRFRGVFGNAVAVSVHVPELHLRLGNCLLSGYVQAKPQ